jgi:hypothetical protein
LDEVYTSLKIKKGTVNTTNISDHHVIIGELEWTTEIESNSKATNHNQGKLL